MSERGRVRTQQHEGLLALARLEVRLGQEHKGLQGFDRGLINIKLQPGAACIFLANSYCRIITAEMGCISWKVRLIAVIEVM
jgi:hypothetical protein